MLSYRGESAWMDGWIDGWMDEQTNELVVSITILMTYSLFSYTQSDWVPIYWTSTAPAPITFEIMFRYHVLLVMCTASFYCFVLCPTVLLSLLFSIEAFLVQTSSSSLPRTGGWATAYKRSRMLGLRSSMCTRYSACATSYSVCATRVDFVLCLFLLSGVK